MSHEFLVYFYSVISAMVVAFIGLKIYKKAYLIELKNIAILSFILAIFNGLIIVSAGYFAFFLIFLVPLFEFPIILYIGFKSDKIDVKRSLMLFFFSFFWFVFFYGINLLLLQCSHPKVAPY